MSQLGHNPIKPDCAISERSYQYLALLQKSHHPDLFKPLPAKITKIYVPLHIGGRRTFSPLAFLCLFTLLFCTEKPETIHSQIVQMLHDPSLSSLYLYNIVNEQPLRPVNITLDYHYTTGLFYAAYVPSNYGYENYFKVDDLPYKSVPVIPAKAFRTYIELNRGLFLDTDWVLDIRQSYTVLMQTSWMHSVVSMGLAAIDMNLAKDLAVYTGPCYIPRAHLIML